MNEFELIERIFSQMQAAQLSSNNVEKGIGDDAAVMSLPVGARLVSCIDTLVQGRHFSADWEQVNQLAFAGNDRSFDRQQLAADLGPRETRDLSDLIVLLGAAVAKFAHAQQFVQVLSVDLDGVLARLQE